MPTAEPATMRASGDERDDASDRSHPGGTPSSSPLDDAPTLVEPGAAPERAAPRGPPAGASGLDLHYARFIDQLRVAPGQPPRLGRFAILSAIGAGGMGLVLSAYDEELDRKVAIKVIHRVDGLESTEGRAAILREAHAMARLAHPNVVPIYEAGELDGRIYLVMEFVRGETLRAWIRDQGDGTRDAGPPGWREVLAMFIAAGRGLAAAHAAGLVHRDFKPDNVLVGPDMRPRVVDFGLASLTSSARDRGSDLPLSSESSVIAGTPAYMAPEQHQGRTTDARADQFSFCVALHEALYGRRPFSAKGRPQLIRQIEAGALDTPTRARVPRALAKVVRRGLAADPERRWPGMDALLAALEAILDRRRQRWIVGGLLVGLVGVVGYGVAWAQTSRDDEAARLATVERCTQRADALAGIWDEPTRARVEAAMVGFESPYAAASWTRVAQTLDRYAARWEALRAETCAATHLHASQSARLHDLRILCLDQRRDELRAFVELLSRSDAVTMENAVSAATSLSPLDRCADREALLSEVELPADAATSAAVTSLRSRLSTVNAYRGTGNYAEGLALAEALVTEAVSLGYRPALAEALAQRGRLLQHLERLPLASESLAEAFWAALASGHERVAAEAASDLVFIEGFKLSRHEVGLRWARHAQAVLEHRGGGEVERAHLLANIGCVSEDQNQLERAAETLREAARLLEARVGPDDAAVAFPLLHLAKVLGQLGMEEESDAAFARTIAIYEGAYGPSHPQLGYPLLQRGTSLLHRGRREAARASISRARDVWIGALGRVDSRVAYAEIALGNVAQEQGDLDEALRRYASARSIFASLHGAGHPEVAGALTFIGDVHVARGELADARESYAQALDLWNAAARDHPDAAYALVGIARIDALSGHEDAAQAGFERALAIFERRSGPQDSELVEPLLGLGLLALTRGDGPSAIQALERAHALLDPGRTPASVRGDVKYALARALVATERDQPRARTLARDAIADLEVAGEGASARRREVAAWLAAP